MTDGLRVLISVAFANQGGVDLLADALAPHAAKARAFIGIRNDITSAQGAARLLGLGVDLRLVDTGARTLLFHPKLYLARGAAQARLIVGSANLTTGGLHNNIEASLVLDMDLRDADDKALVERIEAAFDEIVQGYPDHVIAVKQPAELAVLQATGRLIDETAVSPPRPVSAATSPEDDPLPRIRLKVPPLRRALAAAKVAAKAAAKKAVAKKAVTGAAAGNASPSGAVSAARGVRYVLLWESKPLSRSDLNIPDGGNTNVKGSISLDKGLLPPTVDHRHYFREEVFAALAWAPKSRTVEEAHARFQLVLKGISYGEFDLLISHTMGTTSATYLQNNAMTRLRWGPLRPHVGREDLLGRTLSLYRDLDDPGRFVLEID